MTRSPDGGGTERPDEEDRKDAATASTTTRPEVAPPRRDDDAAAREMERMMERGPAAMPSDRSGERPKLDDVAAEPESAVAKGARVKPRAPGSAPPRAGGRRGDPITGPVAPVEPATRRNKWTIGLVAAGMIVALGWALMRDREPRREPSATAKPPPSAPIQPRGGERPPPPPRPPEPTVAAGGPDDVDPPEVEDVAEPIDRTTPPPDDAIEPPPVGDERRHVPEGTKDDNAAAFRKLPMSADDRAPVGGIGVGGIHVDRISMGATYADGDCTGEADEFSIAGKERPNVCIRVVHAREKEDVAIVWEKSGGSKRRGKAVIKPVHAYRTRAYLMLRQEDVGDWTVRIMSQDGVELASRAFKVVP